MNEFKASFKSEPNSLLGRKVGLLLAFDSEKVYLIVFVFGTRQDIIANLKKKLQWIGLLVKIW